MFAPHKNETVGRRMFWAGILIGSVSAFFIAFPPDWKSGGLLTLLVAVLMLMTAYFSTPYLKFGRKVVAFSAADTGVEAAGGVFTSARKLWWLMVPAMALCAFNIGQYVFAGE